MLDSIDKIYVCHYTKLKERVPTLEKQLEKYGLDVYWVTDYDAEDIDISLVRKYMTNVDKPLGLGGIHENRTLRLSELSLILKHNYVFEDMIKNNYESVLVLEDDVLFVEDFINKFNNQIKDAELDYDLIWVGTCCNLKYPNTVSDKFIYKHNGSRCTHGYIISKNCAKKMMEFLKQNNYPADFAFNSAIEKMNLNNYWMEPSLILQNPMWETSIQKDTKFI
jgi:GR25 family glycosyltransferase involved in LPS biosynthesis